MNFYQGLAVVLLRVLAAKIIFDALTSSVYLLMALIEPSSNQLPVSMSWLVGSTALLAAQIGVGIGLWSFAPAAAKRVAIGIAALSPSISISTARLVEVSVFLIGVFYLANVVPNLMMKAGSIFVMAANQTDQERITGASVFHMMDLTGMLKDLATVAGALFLTFRARDVAKLFTWLREAGLPPAEEAAPAETKPAPGE